MESFRRREWEPRGLPFKGINANAFTNRDLHSAAADLNYELVKEILESGVVDIHNTESIGQSTISGQKPKHLHLHFYLSQVNIKHKIFQRDSSFNLIRIRKSD